MLTIIRSIANRSANFIANAFAYPDPMPVAVRARNQEACARLRSSLQV